MKPLRSANKAAFGNLAIAGGLPGRIDFTTYMRRTWPFLLGFLLWAAPAARAQFDYDATAAMSSTLC
jgi:hypothetical protein